MTLSPSGVLYVGTRKDDKVYALIDSDKDAKAEKVIKVAEKLKMPVDVEVMPDGALLVSDDKAGKIYRIAYAAP